MAAPFCSMRYHTWVFAFDLSPKAYHSVNNLLRMFLHCSDG